MLKTLKEILEEAERDGYAVLAPDFPTLSFASTLIEYAQELHTPIILSYGPDFKPCRDIKDYDLFIRAAREEAQAANVDIVLHLDHAHKIDEIKEAIEQGFTSVMIDASTMPWDENVKLTREVVALAHPAGVSVESELGHVGTVGQYLDEKSHDGFYTDPEEAQKFVEMTGVDALAVAVGTVHGLSPKTPKLDFERLATLHELVPVPLVMHGTSGLAFPDISKAVAHGIRKINVYSSAFHGMTEALAKEIAKPTCDVFSFTEQAAKGIKDALWDFFKASGSLKN